MTQGALEQDAVTQWNKAKTRLGQLSSGHNAETRHGRIEEEARLRKDLLDALSSPSVAGARAERMEEGVEAGLQVGRDTNTRVAALEGNTEVLLDQTAATLEHTSDINSQVRRIEDQVDDLHGLMMRGKTQEAATPADLLVQTEASIASLKHLGKAAKLTVKAQAVEAKAVAKAAAKTAAANARAAAKAAAQEAKKAAAAEKEKEKIQGAIRDR